MTSDEARDLFEDALEGRLDAAQKAAFDAALASDPELREELDAYRMVVVGTAALARGGAEEKEASAPDLLPGVQRRLRQRSRGRFYRDRFSERAGARSAIPILVAILVALLLATGWLAVQNLVSIEPPAAIPPG